MLTETPFHDPPQRLKMAFICILKSTGHIVPVREIDCNCTWGSCHIFGFAAVDVRLSAFIVGVFQCRALCPRCAKRSFWTHYTLMAKVTVVATVFPYTGLLRLLLSPNTQIMS